MCRIALFISGFVKTPFRLLSMFRKNFLTFLNLSIDWCLIRSLICLILSGSVGSLAVNILSSLTNVLSCCLDIVSSGAVFSLVLLIGGSTKLVYVDACFSSFETHIDSTNQGMVYFPVFFIGIKQVLQILLCEFL